MSEEKQNLLTVEDYNQMTANRNIKKSFLMKSFADIKDNKGNCQIEQSEMMAKQHLLGR